MAPSLAQQHSCITKTVSQGNLSQSEVVSVRWADGRICSLAEIGYRFSQVTALLLAQVVLRTSHRALKVRRAGCSLKLRFDVTHTISSVGYDTAHSLNG